MITGDFTYWYYTLMSGIFSSLEGKVCLPTNMRAFPFWITTESILKYLKFQVPNISGKMKDGHGVEVDDCDIEDNDNLDDIDMNGTSTLVISESALSINGDGEESEDEDCHPRQAQHQDRQGADPRQ